MLQSLAPRLPQRQRGVLVAAVALVALLLAAVPAQARQYEIWHQVGCGEAYFQRIFQVHPRGADRLKLSVHHIPGAFGTLEVRSLSEPDRGIVFSFTQPLSWIIGDYEIDSQRLPVGEYKAEAWTHNHAQNWIFCHSNLTLWDNVP